MRESLYKLGLSSTEASVYLLLLSLGPSLPSTLSKKSGIKRPTTYAALERLKESNLISEIKKGKYKYFFVDDPQKLIFQQREKVQIAQDLIDQMKNLSFGTNFGVEVYKGLEGYREMYEDILRVKPLVVSAWMDLDGFLKGIDPKRENKWTQERIKRKIFARLLLRKSESALNLQVKDPSSYREIRFFPEKSLFETTCVLYDDKVVFFDTSKDNSCIKIQNAALNKMLQEIFEIHWRHSPRDRKKLRTPSKPTSKV